MRKRTLAVVVLFGVLGVLSSLSTARAANLRNHIEAVRRSAAVVYLGVVGNVELAEQEPRKNLEARAEVRVLFVARSPTGETPAAAILEYPTWDDEHPPYDGDGQYRLRTGSLVVVFTDAWDGEQIRYLLKGSREELLADLESRRDGLAEMSAEELEFHEIDEDGRRVQAELYERIVSHLESVPPG